nr:hypothetical protein [Desulfobulbaceae bacterium]
MPNFAGNVHHLVLSLSFALLLSSCATLPVGVPVSEVEQVVVKQAFTDLLDRQSGCVDQIDADISVTFESFFYAGKIDGYLQVMQPAYLRFDGLNPFGLTEIVFTTDGVGFTLLAVRDEKGYSGPVTAKKFQQYATSAFSDDFWFLLSGLVPTDRNFLINSVRREEKGAGFWLELDYPERETRLRLLFRPQEKLVDSVAVIPKQGNDSVVFTYQYSSTPEGYCPEPESIEVDTSSNGVMSIVFSKRYPMAKLNKENFQVAIPSNFTKVLIQ